MTLNLTLFVTSDTHGQWIERPDAENLSMKDTAQRLKALQADCENPYLTIDLGDFIQGSGLATYYAQVEENGDMFARVMNHLNYDYQLIGNHEFNFGNQYRDHILKQLKAKILAANTVDAVTGQPIYGQPYDILEIEGTRIGIIGLTTSYIKHWELAKNYQGLDFPDALQTAKKYVAELRPQVDLLILAYHGGFEKDLVNFQPIEPQTGENQGARMLEEIPGIDVLLTGHQHREIAEIVRGVAVVQPGFGGENIGRIDLTIENKKVIQQSVQLIPITKAKETDSSLMEVLDPDYNQGRQWLNHVIGTADLQSSVTDAFAARLYGHPYAELLNQLQLRETGAQFSGIAIVNDNFADFVGPITNEKLLLSYPFYNLIAKVMLTGQDLKEIMEFNLKYFSFNGRGELRVNPRKLDPKPQHYNYDLYSGFHCLVDLKQPVGQRVLEMTDEHTGQPIKMDQEYTVAVTQYRSVGGGNYHWFTKDKVLSLSEIDIAKLIQKALETYTEADWQAINQHYHHMDFVEQYRLAKDPLSLSEL